MCQAVLGTYYLLSYCGLFWQYGKTKTPAEIVTLGPRNPIAQPKAANQAANRRCHANTRRPHKPPPPPLCRRHRRRPPAASTMPLAAADQPAALSPRAPTHARSLGWVLCAERYKSTAEALLVQQNDWYREYLNQSTQTD